MALGSGCMVQNLALSCKYQMGGPIFDLKCQVHVFVTGVLGCIDPASEVCSDLRLLRKLEDPKTNSWIYNYMCEIVWTGRVMINHGIWGSHGFPLKGDKPIITSYLQRSPGRWQVYTSLHATGAERIEMVDVHTLQEPVDGAMVCHAMLCHAMPVEVAFWHIRVWRANAISFLLCLGRRL